MANGWQSSDGKCWNDFVASYQHEVNRQRLAAGLSPSKVDSTGRHGKALKVLISGENAPTHEEFEKRVGNIAQHGFIARVDWNLQYFCTHFGEFEDGHPSIKQGRGSQGQANAGGRFRGGSGGAGGAAQPSTEF